MTIRERLLKEGFDYLCSVFGNNLDKACYESSIAVQKALKGLGIDTTIRCARYIIADDEGWTAHKSNNPSLGGHIIWLGYSETTGSIGHFAVIREDAGEIIDLAVAQASRPEWNMNIDPIWIRFESIEPPIRNLEIFHEPRNIHTRGDFDAIDLEKVSLRLKEILEGDR